MGEAIKLGGGGLKEGNYVWEKYTDNPDDYAQIVFSNPRLITTTNWSDRHWLFDLSSSDSRYDISNFKVEELIGKSITMIITGAGAYHTFTFKENNVVSKYMSNNGSTVQSKYYYDEEAHILKIIEASGEYNSFTYPTIRYYIGKLINFVINNNPDAYPARGYGLFGYYYILLAAAASANVMNLTNDALETVQQDYRNRIEEEVGNA